MQYIGSSTSEYNLEVEAGTYYVRICNNKTLEEYNESDIQTYEFSITPILKADSIVIKKIVGNEGEDTYRSYPQGHLFRTQDFLVVHGYVVAYDKKTKEYYGVGNHLVTLTYYNEHWRHNNTPSLAEKSMSNGTDDDGLFVVGLDLPIAFGANQHYAPLSIQYYDVNTFTITVEGYPSCIYEQNFIQLKYSDYTG